MHDFEKLGVFYLGRKYDAARREATGDLLLYDSRDLVTHAVCVGMTGSGKTGLCIGLLEEAAIDGIPALVIDPKGDLANLLLTFPDLKPEDFQPWINEEDARLKGQSAQEFAAAQADLWKRGLAGWGQDGERIRRLRGAADFAIYTPGSDAGLPLSVLKSFEAPPPEVLEDREVMRDRVSTTATALLALAGIEGDPVRSREHILLASVLDGAWKQNRNLDLADLIGQIQSPPFGRVGVLDLDSFYPARERFELAMALNNLLASPGFEAWMQGEPLDVGALLYTPQGRPRISILSISHLSDLERMFFVALVLDRVVGWMRAQSGTNSLRALLYMDEIFGYFPPVANPPSKRPLLTLLKQARAYGLGVVLATQNPVDLDYKGLSNAGTWFLGRLQTERDKQRVLEGLEGAAASAASKFDRSRTEEILAGLGNRIFLMNNVHEDAPVLFESRWALSYLRGPLTRSQIRTLMAERKRQAAGANPEQPAAAATPIPGTDAEAGEKPVLPPEIVQGFLPVRGTGRVVYRPFVYGSAQVRFLDDKCGVDETRGVAFLVPIQEGHASVNWEEARETEVAPADVEREAGAEGGFEPVPSAAARPRSWTAWNKEFAGWLFATQKIELFRSPGLKEVSRPGETEGDFRVRLQQAAREERDKVAERLRQKYAPRIAMLQERIRRSTQALERERQQASDQKVQTAISIGSSLLGAFLGRKVISTTTLGRAGTAVRSYGRARKEEQDIGRATENVEALQQQLAEMEEQFRTETADLALKIDPATEELAEVTVRPKKTGISVRMFALAWAPCRGGAPAWE